MALPSLAIALGVGPLIVALQVCAVSGVRASTARPASISWSSASSDVLSRASDLVSRDSLWTATARELVGWYDLWWEHGSLLICLRPGGQLYCHKHEASATWALDGDVVRIDWERFGKYEMRVLADRSMVGHAVGGHDYFDWRRAEFKRPLSVEEISVIGDGAGTEWSFVSENASCLLQIQASGCNGVVCNTDLERGHWTLAGRNPTIDWGDRGRYVLVVDAEERTMTGGVADGDGAEQWCKVEWIRNLAIKEYPEDLPGTVGAGLGVAIEIAQGAGETEGSAFATDVLGTADVAEAAPA